MLFLRNLRVQLQERRNRLYKCGYRTYDAELEYLLQFLNGNRYTSCLLTALDLNVSLDFEEWAKDNSTGWDLQFPDTEEGRAKICYGILKQCLSTEDSLGWEHWMQVFSSESSLDARLRDLTESVVDPFVNYLHDKIDKVGNVLYLIERFKLQVEWFRRDELYHLYKENTFTGEANLDLTLRAGLFDGGIDFPFSQPVSPSGKADIVALLDSDDPMVLEVKVFDPDTNKGKSNLAQGFQQITRYAQDYNQSLGYLVVFNCSDNQLIVSHEVTPESEFPPRISYASKTFFVIPIDIHPDVLSASRERPASRIVVTPEELIGPQSPS